MSLEYKILGQELVSYTDVFGTDDTTSYYVSYEEIGGPLFVTFAANSDSLAYSTDAISWTRTLVPNAGWGSVTYADGKFVAVGSPNISAYSTNGVAWTQGALPTNNNGWRSVTHGDGKFVAIGPYASLGAYSTDGITWTYMGMPRFAQWLSVTYGDGRFVAVANDSEVAAYSTDGISWSEAVISASDAQWLSVTYGDGKFVALANARGSAAYSTDGTVWLESSLPESASWIAVAYGDGKFVALQSFSPNFAYSADGISWSAGNLPYAFWTNITYGGDKFVAVAAGNIYGAFAYSPDGITWTLSTIPAGNQYSYGFNALAFGQTTELVETLNIIGGQGTVSTEEFLPITVYTVPEDKQTTVTSIFVANHDDTDSTYDLAVVPAGEELSLKHHIRWDMAVAANDFENISTKITMSAGDKLVIFPSTVDTVSITAFGVEK
jgi:hypothetical protein